MLKNWIYRLGSDPLRSWARFKLGLAFFAVAVGLIFAGARYWVWLQIPGLVVLAIALWFAGYGYLGIFANRFAQTLNQPGGRFGRGK